MADRKITDLAALTAPVATDLLPIIDVSEAANVDKNKSVTLGTLFRTLPDGTAGAPSIAFLSDTGTSGIYRTAANEVAISNNSSFTGKFTTAGFQLGTGTAAAQLHLFSTDTTDQVIIENTDAGLDTAPDLVLYRNSASPTANDNLGNIEFRGEDAGGNAHAYAQIIAGIQTTTDGAEDGILDLMTSAAGTVASRIRLYNQFVGIGETAPNYPLHITTTVASTALQIEGNVDDPASSADITLYHHRNDAAGVADDIISTVYYRSKNDNATPDEVDYAAIEGSITDPSDGAEGGQLAFKIQTNGTLTTQLEINSSNATLGVRPIIPTHTPASATATGTTGELGWDNGYFYVCTATNTWKKIGISTDGVPGSTTEFSSGSEAAPSITFADDTDTGIYNPSANEIAITTGGSEALRIDNNGNVGIGENNPLSLLHVSNGTSVTSLDADADDFYISNAGNVGMTLGTNASGKCSIYFAEQGTSNNRGRIIYDTSTEGFEFFCNAQQRATISSAGTFEAKAAASTAPFIANIGASEVVRIDSDGNVGIGTSSPNERFSVEVNGTTNRAIEIYNGDTLLTSGEVVHAIRFTQNDASNPNTTHASIETVTTGSTGLLNMVFKARDNTEYMRIDYSGRVGIGTTNPTQALQVAGAIVATGAAATYTADGIYLQNKGSSIFDVSAWRTGASGSVLTFSTDSGSDAAPVERMRIKTDGTINFSNVAVYADNAAAKTGGLVDGDVYRTSTGDLKIVYT